MIFIIYEYRKAEEEYVSSTATFSDIARKFNIPYGSLIRYAKKNGWAEKRKNYKAPPSLDLSKLERSSETLEAIIESAFSSVSLAASQNKDVDTKTLKELTSALKEAINIKQNIYMLPLLTEQKQLELEQKISPAVSDSENEIRVILENGTDKFCV